MIPMIEKVKEAIDKIEYVCPVCKNDLVIRPKEYFCDRCSLIYPIINGIPNFTFSKTIKGVKFQQINDYAEYMNEDLNKLTHRELVLKYFVAQRSEYKNYRYMYPNLSDEELKNEVAMMWAKARLNRMKQSESILSMVQRLGKLPQDKRWGKYGLDVACGSGALILKMSTKFKVMYGFDLLYKDLYLTKKLAEENNIDNIILFCAYAEHLPFKNHQFDAIFMHNAMEHIRNKPIILEEIKRNANGLIYFNQVNRFRLREPHTGILLVGYCPTRKLMDKYVQLVGHRRFPPENYCAIGYFGLKCLLNKHFKGWNWYLEPNYLSLCGHKIAEPKLYKTILQKCLRIPILGYMLFLLYSFINPDFRIFIFRKDK